MPDVFTVLVCGLATFFPIFLFLETSGPFNIFDRLRMLMGISPVLIADMDGDNKLVDWKESGSFTSKLFNCNRCLTPYVAFVITIVCPSDATGTLEIVRTFVINWLAVSAVALIIYEVLLP